MRLLLTLSILSLLFSSCFKEDDKVVLATPGGATVAAVALGSDYENQVFFSLRNGVILTNDHAAWDLAFESSPNGYHVWINGGKGVLAGTNNSPDFTGTTTTEGIAWHWDEASWNPDSTAIGNWKQDISRTPEALSSTMRTDEAAQSNRVYLIDRGSNYATEDRYWKVVFQSVDGSAYRIKYGRLDNSLPDSITLNKDPQQAYTYFTFDNGGHNIVMEPNVNAWDFVFTRYRHIFYYTTPPTPYFVNGALLNPDGMTAALDSITPYDQIDLGFAEQMALHDARNAIGYNWKYYDFSAQTYVVKPHFSYVVRDREGYYWKLRFLDFYNDQGQKGYPKFEYQRL